jgi:hypothetical protein
MAKYSISCKDKFFLIFEAIFIFSYLVCGIIELCLCLNMYAEHIQSQQFYYYYLIHSRVRIPSYNAMLDFKNVNAECPLYPDPPKEPSYLLQFKPRKVLELSKITNTNVTDVSDTVQIYDRNNDITVLKNTSYLYDLGYYTFDLQVQNTSSVDFLTKYQFSIWRQAKMCVLTLILSNPKAMALIPSQNNCKEYLQNEYSVECGTYANETYKLCIQRNYLNINETLSATQFDSSTWDQDWICPYNYFKIDFDPNPHYNASDPKSEIIKGLVYQQFMNNVTDPLYANYSDKYLFYDLDKAILGTYQNISTPDESFVFASADPTEYIVGKPYGFMDSFGGFLDNYDFLELYNQSYYKEAVTNNQTNLTTYDPDFLQGSSGNSYYRPVDISPNKTQIKLTYWGHPILSQECFKNFISAEGYYYYWDNLNKIGTEFLDESLPLLIAWVIVQLFISIFWHFKIRFSLILYKFKKGNLAPPDEKSEFETKFTSKLVNVIMFALLFNGLLFHDKTFSYIIDFTQGVLDNRCYPDQITLDSFSTFQNYVNNMRGYNSFILKLLIVSASTESLLMLVFTLEFLLVLKKKRELRLLEEALLKEN